MLAAEAAIKNGEFNTARDACHEFFLSDSTRDQFYCRALFIKVSDVKESFPNTSEGPNQPAKEACPPSSPPKEKVYICRRSHGIMTSAHRHSW